MKKLLKISFIVILVLFITNCSEQESNPKGSINREKFINNYNKLIKTNDVIDTLSYRYIPLETTDESVFGMINKVFIDDNRIFILDRDIARQAFIFDIKGKFISKLGTKGQGPNEFSNLQGMTIDKKGKNIILFDLNSRKLLYYTYNGDFIKSVKFKTYPGMNVSYVGNGIIASYSHSYDNNETNQLLLFNEKGEVIDKKYPLRNKKLTYIMPCKYFSKNDKGVFCIPTFEDKICKIDGNGTIKEVLDFGMADLMINDEDKEKYKSTKELHKLKKYFYFQKLMVTDEDNFIVENTFYNDGIFVMGNIKNGKIIVGTHSKDGIIQPESIEFPSVIGTYKNYFIGIFYPFLHKDKDEFKNSKQTDNTGLLLFKLKKDFTSIEQ